MVGSGRYGGVGVGVKECADGAGGAVVDDDAVLADAAGTIPVGGVDLVI